MKRSMTMAKWVLMAVSWSLLGACGNGGESSQEVTAPVDTKGDNRVLTDAVEVARLDVTDVFQADADLRDLSIAVQCPVESGEKLTEAQCKEIEGLPCASGKCGISSAGCSCSYYAECNNGLWECLNICDDSCECGFCPPDVNEIVDEISSDAPDAPDCGVEGDVFGEPPGSLVCCKGLVAVPHQEPDELGHCGADFFPSAICTACGDQVCGTAENSCNCPMDCPPPECIPEGETGPVTPDAPPCCAGLPTGIAEADPLSDECVPLDGAFLCTDCNNGICSPWENTCICPEDCPEAGGDCFGLGEQFNGLDTDLTCCEGLVAAPDNVKESGACLSPNCPCMICLPCGDQSCDAFETHCNCPEDCAPETPCAKAGEFVPVWLPNYECCDGLTKVPNEEYDPDTGQCTPLVGTSLCTACPNGVCELWETPCTCPDDC